VSLSKHNGVAFATQIAELSLRRPLRRLGFHVVGYKGGFGIPAAIPFCRNTLRSGLHCTVAPLEDTSRPHAKGPWALEGDVILGDSPNRVAL